MKNDHELIREFQNGDQKAFDDLVKRYLQTVYAFFIRITHNEQDAEDLSQEVFLKLYRYLKRFRFNAQFKTYLFRVNANTANNYLRRNRWRGILHLDQTPELSEEQANDDGSWSRSYLWDAVAKLPRQQRMVITLRVAQDLPYRDIAGILGMSEGSAKVNYHHGVKRLKTWLGGQNNGL